MNNGSRVPSISERDMDFCKTQFPGLQWVHDPYNYLCAIACGPSVDAKYPDGRPAMKVSYYAGDLHPWTAHGLLAGVYGHGSTLAECLHDFCTALAKEQAKITSGIKLALSPVEV